MEQFTPAKLGGKEMKGLSTASKLGKESEADSPAPIKSKAIFKERTASGKGGRLGVKLHFSYRL